MRLIFLLDGKITLYYKKYGMQKLFNKIMVPIDFSSKSKSTVEKAVQIAKLYNCSIYLLHVLTASPFASIAVAEGHMAIPFNSIDNKSELEFQLEKLKNYIRLLSDGPIKVEYKILIGTWDDMIIDLVNQYKFDLLLIGQKG